jgi:hypothetical protein
MTQRKTCNTRGLQNITESHDSFNVLWRILFNRLNIFIRNMCLANYGASEAIYLCNVVEKIHQYFRPKTHQCF